MAENKLDDDELLRDFDFEAFFESMPFLVEIPE